MHTLQRIFVTAPRRMLALASIALSACSSVDRALPIDPSDASRTNVRLLRVEFTQAVQAEDGSLPLLAGTAAAVNVVVLRSAETVVEAPLVLRLFRNGNVVFTDTAFTGGVLGPAIPRAGSNAQFLIPGSLVAADVSWQVELDPLRTQPDSTRVDNVLPRGAPASLVTVAVQPLRLRLVPVILSRHNDLTGNVSAANVELYVRLVRQIFPAGALTVTVGTPVVSYANVGPLPGRGADVEFWNQVMGEVDGARAAAGPTAEYWYGVVPYPAGYGQPIQGGRAFIPDAPEKTGLYARSGVGLDVMSPAGAGYASEILAHELGHNFGRLHAPGCGAVAPIDSAFRGAGSTTFTFGHDVWSWANGFSRGAQAVGRETHDIMSYCSLPKWITPYTYEALLAWRRVAPVFGKTTATRAPLAMP